MKTRTMTLVASACLAASAAWASQHTEAPKPGPEVKKLEAFAGKWKGESEMKPSPFAPAGKMTSEDDCTWFEGGFELVCRSRASGAMGNMKSEMVLGWNAEEKVYKYMGFDSMGMMGAATERFRETPEPSPARTNGGKVINPATRSSSVATTATFKWRSPRRRKDMEGRRRRQVGQAVGQKSS